MLSIWLALAMVRPGDDTAKQPPRPPPSAQMQVQANLVKLESRINQVAAQRGYTFEKVKPACPYCRPGKLGDCCRRIVARKGKIALVRKAARKKKGLT